MNYSAINENKNENGKKEIEYNENKMSNLNNYENFDNMPQINNQTSDEIFQCSDNVEITGNILGSVTKTTLSNCKALCNTNEKCIGFDFDNKNKECIVKNEIKDVRNKKNNNILCIKKNQEICKKNESVIKTDKKPETIYVDLPCFLNRIDTLKYNSSNTLIDLQLLISNIKSCCYVKKDTNEKDTSTNNISNNKSNTITTTNIELPKTKQESIKVYGTQASVLYTNSPKNMLLGMTEPFDLLNINNNDVMKIVILILILLFLMKLK